MAQEGLSQELLPSDVRVDEIFKKLEKASAYSSGSGGECDKRRDWLN